MYPVSYETDHLRDHNRWTTFFRLILAIPWVIVLEVYAIAALVVWIIAFFALLILGRYPDWAYNFNVGFLRYSMRVIGWVSLQTDEWPPFGIGEDPTYPVRPQVAPRAERQSRLKVLFRMILVLPLLVVAYPIQYIHYLASLAAWLTIVFRGYMPAPLHNALNFCLAFQMRLSAYSFFLRDEYPPVSDEGWQRKQEKEALNSGSGGPAPPAVEAPSTTATEQPPPPPPPPAAQ